MPKNAQEKCDNDGKNYKKGKKKSKTNKDMCEEIYRVCKMKKNKWLNKRKVKKKKAKKKKGGRKGKQSSAVAVLGNCNNITCLNDLIEVLKIDKDMVQNYIQQKKRLDTRLTLAGPFKAQ